MQKSNTLTVDLAAIVSNISAMRAKLPQGTRIMPMVKAEAYGTDAIFMTFFLEKIGIDIVGVSQLDEGVALRKAGAKIAIFVISAPTFEMEKAVAFDLEVAISTFEEAQELNTLSEKYQKQAKVHLHIDTGMKRFGTEPALARKLALYIQQLPFLHLEGVMTHFTDAESSAEDSCSREQLDSFFSTLKTLPLSPHYIHVANTPAMRRFSLPHCNMVRVGLGIFGFSSTQEEREALQLTPALSLTTRIAAFNECKRGDYVGYGTLHKVTRERARIGILPIGYHDGFHNFLAEKGFVYIQGKRAKIVGKICMDFMMVDLSDVEGAKLGDSVLLFGKELPPKRLRAGARSM